MSVINEIISVTTLVVQYWSDFYCFLIGVYDIIVES